MTNSTRTFPPTWRRTLFLVCVTLSIFRYSSVTAIAQSFTWESNLGPFDGAINSALIDGQNWYMGGSYGLLSSSDAGLHWSFAPLSHSAVMSIASMNDSVVIGSFGAGVMLSADRGATWHSINNGLQNMSVWCFAQVDARWYCGTSGGLYSSSNKGASWTIDSAGCGAIRVNAIQQMDSVLVIGSTTGIFRRSASTAWTKSDSGFATPVINCLATLNHTIFLGGNSGVYASSDGGLSWIQAGSQISTFSVRSLKAASSKLYATTNHGVWKSDDNGNTWTALPFGTSDTNTTSVALSGSNCLVGTIANGAYFTSDAGSTWSHVDASASVTRAIHASVSKMLCSSFNGLWVSSDAGSTWSFGSMKSTTIPSITERNGILYVCTASNGVYRSTDEGSHWSQSISGLSDTLTRTLLADSIGVFTGTHSGVFLSTDDGAHWIARNVGMESQNVTTLARHSSTTVAGTSTSGLYRSEDDGMHWVQKSLVANDTVVLCSAFDGGTFYVGTTKKIYRSIDEGATWTPIQSPASGSVFRSMYASNGALFVTADSAGLWLTTNSGADWKNCGLQSNTINAVDYGLGYLFVATNGGGIMRASWSGSTSVAYDASEASRAHRCRISNHATSLMIACTGDRIVSVAAWDILGRQMLSYETSPATCLTLDASNTLNIYCLVRIRLESGVVETQALIVN